MMHKLLTIAMLALLAGCEPSGALLDAKDAPTGKAAVAACHVWRLDVDNDPTTGDHLWYNQVEDLTFGFDVIVALDGLVRDSETFGILPATAVQVPEATSTSARTLAFNAWCDADCTPSTCMWVSQEWIEVEYGCAGDPYTEWPDIWMSGLSVLSLEYVAEWNNCYGRQD